jgi:two-component system nitrate/nitrite response regulator NarL
MTKRNLTIFGKNQLFREGLRQVLESPDMAIIGEASSLIEGAALLRSTEHKVDLVFYDASDNTPEDFQALQAIGREFPEVDIIVLTDNLSRSDFDMALAGGVRGFLPASISSAALRISLELILLGENIFPVPIALSGGRAGNPQTPAAPGATELGKTFSAREVQLLRCLEAGQPNKAIARNLGMSEQTVKVQLKALLRKINAGNRTQAAVWSLSHKVTCSELDYRGYVPTTASAHGAASQGANG